MFTLSEQRKFHLIFVHGSESSGNESSWEREFQGTKVPGSESSIFAPGSESTWKQKFLLPSLELSFIVSKTNQTLVYAYKMITNQNSDYKVHIT